MWNICDDSQRPFPKQSQVIDVSYARCPILAAQNTCIVGKHSWLFVHYQRDQVVIAYFSTRHKYSFCKRQKKKKEDYLAICTSIIPASADVFFLWMVSDAQTQKIHLKNIYCKHHRVLFGCLVCSPAQATRSSDGKCSGAIIRFPNVTVQQSPTFFQSPQRCVFLSLLVL